MGTRTARQVQLDPPKNLLRHRARIGTEPKRKKRVMRFKSRDLECRSTADMVTNSLSSSTGPSEKTPKAPRAKKQRGRASYHQSSWQDIHKAGFGLIVMYGGLWYCLRSCPLPSLCVLGFFCACEPRRHCFRFCLSPLVFVGINSQSGFY